MKEKVSICCGSFDGTIHPGHRNFLLEAKKQGDILVVFINTDEIIRRNKYREPLLPQQERVKYVAELGIANFVLPFQGDDTEQLEQIAALKPYVYCFSEGGNSPFNQLLQEKLAPLGTIFITIPRFEPETYSTTKLHFQHLLPDYGNYSREKAYDPGSRAHVDDELRE